MSLYKITIDNRDYSSFHIFNASTLEQIELYNFNPLEHKLVNNDVFTYDTDTCQSQIIHSSTRMNENIPCVLILADNKTYGRDNSKRGGRLLYKCVPDDTRIPIFLVPYEIKQLGFSKVIANVYVTVRFNEWTNKHPFGYLNQVIGPVDELENFYEYQLYCKSLNVSIQKFNKDTIKAVKEHMNAHDTFITTICEKYRNIENRTDWHIFTIDPPTSLDFDDAFSIRTLENGNQLLSIYIANVTIWMDALNLWSSFSQRISTIYLPDRKRPMLPTILSDGLCSLQQMTRRFALVLDIVLDAEGNIISESYANCLIQVYKNYAYEESLLLEDKNYKKLMECAKQMATKYKYISSIRNSHDVVCYLMIVMNYKCAQNLLEYKNGIFRSTIITKNVELSPSLPNDVSQFIKIWNSACGQYIDIHGIPTEQLEPRVKHELLEVDAYVHMTSPIRRLVDFLNMIQFQNNHGMIQLSEHATTFYTNWLKQLEYINTTMRAIRRVQTDCSLLDTCIKSPSVLDAEYDGYCFDKLKRNDGLYQYIVFLPTIRMASRITMRENLENYEKRQYKLYLFNNEEKFKKKIRLQIV